MTLQVVFLNPAGVIGGAERALLDLIASLRQTRPAWRLAVIAAADGDLVQAASALGAQSSVVAFPRALAVLGDAGAGAWADSGARTVVLAVRLLAAAPAIAAYRRQLTAAITAIAPDIIHTNGFKMHLLGIWAAARHKSRQIPVLWHMHDFVRSRPMMGPLLRAHAQRCAAAVAVSHSVAQDARAALGRRLPIFTVYNAIDLARFAPAGPLLDLDRLAGMPPLAEGGVRVGMVATMARWKGHETFLRALAALPSATPARGYVIGGPLYETADSQSTIAELRVLATRMGLDGRVGFTGFVADVAPAMRTLDIVVHASTQPEPFGLVIAEAMACGRSVIISAAGGATELIDEGIDALAHRPGDAAGLARLIEQLANDRALRQRIGRAAAQSSARRFTHARLSADLLPIYRTLTPLAV
jgi:glycosyltransferase involved in cell wall biosynthesis